MRHFSSFPISFAALILQPLPSSYPRRIPPSDFIFLPFPTIPITHYKPPCHPGLSLPSTTDPYYYFTTSPSGNPSSTTLLPSQRRNNYIHRSTTSHLIPAIATPTSHPQIIHPCCLFFLTEISILIMGEQCMKPFFFHEHFVIKTKFYVNEQSFKHYNVFTPGKYTQCSNKNRVERTFSIHIYRLLAIFVYKKQKTRGSRLVKLVYQLYPSALEQEKKRDLAKGLFLIA
jgi:hypothetical protein